MIVDWKTDEVEDPELLAARREQYEAQVEMYAGCWEAITGEAVSERRVLWTSRIGTGLQA